MIVTRTYKIFAIRARAFASSSQSTHKHIRGRHPNSKENLRNRHTTMVAITKGGPRGNYYNKNREHLTLRCLIRKKGIHAVQYVCGSNCLLVARQANITHRFALMIRNRGGVLPTAGWVQGERLLKGWWGEKRDACCAPVLKSENLLFEFVRRQKKNESKGMSTNTRIIIYIRIERRGQGARKKKQAR